MRNTDIMPSIVVVICSRYISNAPAASFRRLPSMTDMFFHPVVYMHAREYWLRKQAHNNKGDGGAP